MLRFRQVHLTNVGLFKKAKFDFQSSSLTFVTGLNQNAGNSTNAAGKSFFFSQIYDLIYGVPILGSRRDRLTDGKVRFSFSKESGSTTTDYLAIRTLKNRKESLQVYERINNEWVDKGFRELVEARKFIQSIISYTPKEFETLVYIDGRIPHALIMGDTSARKTFFTNFFRLDAQSNVRSLVNAQLKELQTSKTTLTVHRQRYKELKERLAKPIAELDEALSITQQRIEIVKRKIESVRSLQELRNAYDLTQEHHATVLRYCKNDWSRFALTSRELKTSLKVNEERLEEAEKSSQAVEEYRNAKRKLKEINVKLEELGEITSTVPLRLRIKKREEQQLRLEANTRKTKETLDELDSTPTTCSKCGQPWPHAQSQKTEDRTRKECKEILWNNNLEVRKLSTELSELRQKLTTIDKHNGRIELLKEQRDEYKAIKLPSSIPDENEVLVLKQRIAKLSKAVQAFSAVSGLLDKVVAYANTCEEKRQLLSGSDKLSERYERLTTEYAELKYQRKEQLQVRSDLEETRKAIISLKERLKDEPSLKLLAEVFGKRGGLEKAIMNSICEKLEAQVNRYAHLLFLENYRFSFQLDAQFDILVHRINGKNEVVSDVRKLSGAESRLFNLLLLVALMSFVPASRRCNTLILDEPDANMGLEVIETLMGFLPVLNSVIPHIVFITPQKHILDLANQQQLQGQLLTVVKKGRESTLRITKQGNVQ
jgi:DNA repair exonuclease SbcCD ATPase subunit